jgi:hypothetical protein
MDSALREIVKYRKFILLECVMLLNRKLDAGRRRVIAISNSLITQETFDRSRQQLKH